MTSKTLFVLAALCLALAALAPLAGASLNDDALSRTFPHVRIVHGDAQEDGIGWHDSEDPPNICLANIKDARVDSGGFSYYENGRVHMNNPGSTSPSTVGGSVSESAPCPAAADPECGSDCRLHAAPVQVAPAGRTVVPQSGQVCTRQSAFVDCIATDGRWLASVCPWDRSYFIARTDPNKGVLGGTGFAGNTMSEDIYCSSFTPPVDFSLLLGAGGDPLSSGPEGFPLAHYVTYGDSDDDTGYLVSCLEATYTVIDSSVVPPVVTVDTEDGVDYFLALDLDAEGGPSWDAAVEAHFRGSYPEHAPGVYDLGGDNDCGF